jgi:hypothetical protein
LQLEAAKHRYLSVITGALVVLILVTTSIPVSFTSAVLNLVPNGDFEKGLSDWRGLWTRESNAGQVVLDMQTYHRGTCSARIEHWGKQDWSFDPNAWVDVKSGDLFELEAWVRIQGNGHVTLGVVAYDKRDSVLDWQFAGRTLTGPKGWTSLLCRFFIPQNIVKIHPRLTGDSISVVWLDDFSLAKRGNVIYKEQSEELTIKNAAISVTLHTGDVTLSVYDKRTGGTWSQQPLMPDALLKEAHLMDHGIKMVCYHASSAAAMIVSLELHDDLPELTMTISMEGALPIRLQFPNPFVTETGTYLVVPVNEGVSYPVDDTSIEPMEFIAYGGHGICMAFWGVTDGEKGHMAIIETPDDAFIRINRLSGKLCVSPGWDSQKGEFGYPRRLRYVFFDRGGHVAICKRYRTYAQTIGLFKTLKQKLQENQNVDLLVGAVNVWCWEDPRSIVPEMRSLGIDRILWTTDYSSQCTPEIIKAMNEMNVLTSRYDIYEIVMDPENFKFLDVTYISPDWPTDAWPKDIIVGPDGDWVRGWPVKGKDGQWYYCGVLSDKQALKYAKNRIPEELKTKTYRSRFIDTTTALPWLENYRPYDPMTRSESRYWRTELLRFVSEEMRLVTGSETGHDAAVPYVHYFEGMLSLGPYRVPDAGRNVQQIWDVIPEQVLKFQVGHQYRLPLWELVYHDCVVAQWYWGDYSNKLPTLWDKRDLFNTLYGTPPMFMFDRAIWQQNRERFVRSYRSVCPVARTVGYSQMVDHRFLTQDRSVQQTVFANGITVTVNFGSASYRLPDGTHVPPMGYNVSPAPT